MQLSHNQISHSQSSTSIFYYYYNNNNMVAGTVTNEIASPVSPARLWKAIVKDSHNLMPKLMPDIISSIAILEGDGGPGTIRQSNFTDGNVSS